MELKTNKENVYITVEIFYDVGGYSYATHKSQDRGYYVSVNPEIIIDKGEYTLRSSVAFSGCKMLIEKATRLSEKKLQEFNNKIKIDDYKHIVDIVAKENGLILL